MDKEPIGLAASPGGTRIHISSGVSAMTGFRDKVLCGFVSANDFKPVGPVKNLSADDQDLLCANCVRRWANTKED